MSLSLVRDDLRGLRGNLKHKNRAPVYSDKTGNSENGTEEGGDQASGTEKVSQEFTEKTDLLLEYIERTYLADGYVFLLWGSTWKVF